MRMLTGLWRRRPLRLGVGFVLICFLLPQGLVLGSFYIGEAGAMNWWEARRDSSAQAPDPATTPEAVVEVYAARAYNWRGAFGVHTWIAGKAAGADHYVRYEVIGWRHYRGLPVVSVGPGIPDGYWYGNKPEKLRSFRGEKAGALIGKIAAAAGRYPFPERYHVWPGPNSNTFTAFIARAVPELGLDLPPLAIGKDFLGNGSIVGRAPSGSGYQLSLYGLFGPLLAKEEGLELNLLGLSFGIDVWPPALKLPGLGRIGVPEEVAGE
jgi:Protein of unknown function (DUF3750)